MVRRRYRLHQARVYPYWRLRGHLLRAVLCWMFLLPACAAYQISLLAVDHYILSALAFCVLGIAVGIVAWVVREIRNKAAEKSGSLWPLYRVRHRSRVFLCLTARTCRAVPVQSKDFRLMFGCAYLEYTEVGRILPRCIGGTLVPSFERVCLRVLCACLSAGPAAVGVEEVSVPGPVRRGHWILLEHSRAPGWPLSTFGLRIAHEGGCCCCCLQIVLLLGIQILYFLLLKFQVRCSVMFDLGVSGCSDSAQTPHQDPFNSRLHLGLHFARIFSIALTIAFVE